MSWEKRANSDVHAEATSKKFKFIEYLNVNCMPGIVLRDSIFEETGHTRTGGLVIAGLQREFFREA